MGLEDMMAKYSPSLASYQMGQKHQSTMAMEAEKLKQLQLQNQHTAALNPLNLQAKEEEVKEKKRVNRMEDQLEPHKIAASISEMSTKIGDDGMKRLSQDGEKMHMLAEMLEKVPAMARSMLLKDTMAKYGAQPGANPFLDRVINMDGANLPQALRDMGKGMALAHKSYIQNQALAHSAQANQRSMNDTDNYFKQQMNNADNETQIKIAKIQAEARQAVAAERAKATKYMTENQLKAYYQDLVAKGEATPEQIQALEAIRTQELKKAAAASNTVTPAVMGQPTNQQIAANGGNVPAPQASVNLGDMATKAWGSYDPNTYMYRVNPKTGQIERKKK
jgi:hypothetical protein